MSSAESDARQDGGRPPTGRLHTHVIAIAAGEGTARLCNLILVVFLSRTFGVRAAGAYAIAQALFLYQSNGTDFGLRQTGARLVARNPGNIRQVVRFIQRRRILLALLMMALGYWYGRAGPVPGDARAMVSLYALAIFGYGLSVDWLAWGMQRFAFMSGWRAFVSVIGVSIAIVSVRRFNAGLLIVPLATGLAYLIAGAWLWVVWAGRVVKSEPKEMSGSPLADLPDWRSTAVLGIALLMYQAFFSIDTVMLAGMTDSVQTGLYSAAYRLLLLVLAIYYFIMQAVYPRLAAIPEGQQRIRMLRRPLLFAVAAGVGAAIAMGIARKPLIELLYGNAFAPSAALAGPLLFAIPLDFVTSVLLTVLVAWDHPRRVIAATGTAVATNVVLNLFLIPRYGALGAAFATPVSYVPFLLTLVWQLLHVSKQQTQSEDATDVVSSAMIS
jgi:O-antigen/teichoic acid export membrane protein